MADEKAKIGIIGTGNFAQAVAKRLHRAGYEIHMGSRRPLERTMSTVGNCLCDIAITTVEDCIKKSDIIFVAVHMPNYKDCLQNHVELFNNKITIDVSNRDKPSKTSSNAEYLSSLLPRAVVVKAFNVISAHAMDNDCAGGSREIFIASDDASAREKVAVVARDIGFQPVDMGLIKSSRQIEAFPLKLFPEWRAPIAFTIGVFNMWLLYAIFIYFIKRTAYRWDQIFVKVLNKPLCMTAITVLACTFLPSSVAALFQIYYGTKHVAFPAWLDRWLKTRKQLGLVAFVLISIHVIMSVLIMSPTYLSSWYQSTVITIPGNLTSDYKIPIKTWMVWKGEAACLVGIIAFVCLCIMAISTIPSITNSLNWKEWRFVQSKLGHMTLFLSIAHVVIMGAPGWAKGGPIKTVQSITFLSALLPTFTFLLKFILSLPCINRYVLKIRRGWESSRAECRAKCTKRQTSKGYILTNGFDNKKNTISDEAIIINLEEASSCQCASMTVV